MAGKFSELQELLSSMGGGAAKMPPQKTSGSWDPLLLIAEVRWLDSRWVDGRYGS